MHWQAVLENPAPRNHFVQLYELDPELFGPLALYVSRALDRHEAVILIMTPSHTRTLSGLLADKGFDTNDLQLAGQLMILDARQTLASFCENGVVDRERFFQLAEPIIVGAKRSFGSVCAFGEMVNLLWEAGSLSAAIHLERYWHELLRKHPFSLMCAYAMDHLGSESFAGPLQQVCRVHSHVIPTTNYERLDRSVSLAIDGVLGPQQANMLRSLVLAQRRRLTTTEMPLAQSLLIWLKEHMPVMAEKVLARSRAHFERESARKNPTYS